MQEQELLNGWLPQRLIFTSRAEVKVQWFYVGPRLFTEPFFDETIASCLSLPENSSRPVTPLQTLISCAAKVKPIYPNAFIYHTSRCGSTLLSQILSCDERIVVLSEVPLLDEIIQLNPSLLSACEISVQELFQAAITLLGSKRTDRQQFLFIKTDSWHILFQEKISHWYPDVLSILLYRSPFETAASQLKNPGMHSVPGLLDAGMFGLQKEFALHMHREEYLDYVLAAYMNRYIEILHHDTRVLLANYNDGSERMAEAVISECDLFPSSTVLHAMATRSKFHSKQPHKSYSGDEGRPQLSGTYSRSMEKYMVLLQLQKRFSHLHGA